MENRIIEKILCATQYVNSSNKVDVYEFVAGMLKRNEMSERSASDICSQAMIHMGTYGMEVMSTVSDMESRVDAIDGSGRFFDCDAFWKEKLGIDTHAKNGDFCKVCRYGEGGASNNRQLEIEQGVISSICKMDFEKGKKYLAAVDCFMAFEELNSKFNGKLRTPCVLQIPRMIVGVLSADNFLLYKEILDSTDKKKREEVAIKIAKIILMKCEKKCKFSMEESNSTSMVKVLGGYLYNKCFADRVCSDEQMDIFFIDAFEDEMEEDEFDKDVELGDTKEPAATNTVDTIKENKETVEVGSTEETENETIDTKDEAVENVEHTDNKEETEKKPPQTVVKAEVEPVATNNKEETDDKREYMLTHDSLTGLRSQNAYLNEREKYSKENYYVVFFDVNELKYVNDTYSHANGDKMLREISAYMRSTFYVDENVYRAGGDEFVAFYPKSSTTTDELKETIKIFQKDVSKMESGKDGFVYSIAVGMVDACLYETIIDAIDAADHEMYANKKVMKEKRERELLERAEKERAEINKDFLYGENEDTKKDLKNHPFFSKNLPLGKGGWFSAKDEIEQVQYKYRRYIVPFADNMDKDNVILHQEITSAELEGMYELSIGTEKTAMELSFLSDKVRIEQSVAIEVCYVTDAEKYILLIWNAGTQRYNYITLVDKENGVMNPLPVQIVRMLKKDSIKKMCFQPYLLCGVLGLYERDIDIKNVHAIFSHYKVLSYQGKESPVDMESVFKVYMMYPPSERFQKEIYIAYKRFEDKGVLLTMMPLYRSVMKLQFSLAEAIDKAALCASQQKKDLMYGYSYLAAGVYPSMQKARFKLTRDGEFIFNGKAVPSISYEPGYIVDYTFSNIEEDGDETKIKVNEKENRRARQLLLKELAKRMPAFYHSHMKILYYDNYHITFFMTHAYRDDNQRVIEQSLYRECTRYRVRSNHFKATYYATAYNMVRLVTLH